MNEIRYCLKPSQTFNSYLFKLEINIVKLQQTIRIKSFLKFKAHKCRFVSSFVSLCVFVRIVNSIQDKMDYLDKFQKLHFIPEFDSTQVILHLIIEYLNFGTHFGCYG